MIERLLHSTKDLVLRIKTKLNHRAESQSAHTTSLVTELYELATLSERLLLLRSNSSQSLLDHCQADVLDREGWSHPAVPRLPSTSVLNRHLFMEPFELYASHGG